MIGVTTHGLGINNPVHQDARESHIVGATAVSRRSRAGVPITCVALVEAEAFHTILGAARA